MIIHKNVYYSRMLVHPAFLLSSILQNVRKSSNLSYIPFLCNKIKSYHKEDKEMGAIKTIFNIIIVIVGRKGGRLWMPD